MIGSHNVHSTLNSQTEVSPNKNLENKLSGEQIEVVEKNE